MVEGDSDELVFQRAYMDKHNGRLPIENRIDVISVALTFKRFLEIAEKIGLLVAVITDNDGDFETKVKKKYMDYQNVDCIKIFADDRDNLKTLEPQFVDANATKLNRLCEVLGINITKYDTGQKILDYMDAHKTAWALSVFESNKTVHYPEYIQNAVAWCDEQ